MEISHENGYHTLSKYVTSRNIIVISRNHILIMHHYTKITGYVDIRIWFESQLRYQRLFLLIFVYYVTSFLIIFILEKGAWYNNSSTIQILAPSRRSSSHAASEVSLWDMTLPRIIVIQGSDWSALLVPYQHDYEAITHDGLRDKCYGKRVDPHSW